MITFTYLTSVYSLQTIALIYHPALRNILYFCSSQRIMGTIMENNTHISHKHIIFSYTKQHTKQIHKLKIGKQQNRRSFKYKRKRKS